MHEDLCACPLIMQVVTFSVGNGIMESLFPPPQHGFLTCLPHLVAGRWNNNSVFRPRLGSFSGLHSYKYLQQRRKLRYFLQECPVQ
ncbi:hypothetical protein J4Q44_G00254190 [Coregonus suidteri]|uniref:Uncharacterized protein n=1 Tax=Coregonus suidteri TaxID=861788 RepID=A0AAN8QNW5_9TELE